MTLGLLFSLALLQGARAAASPALEQGASSTSTAKDTPPPPPLPPPQPYDPELDGDSSPSPDNSDAYLGAGDDDDDSDQGVEVSDDDSMMIDLHKQWVSAGLGLLRNTPDGSGSSYFTGAGFRYGYDIADLIFMRSAKSQDSLTLEGALYFYNILNLDQANDSYDLMPVTITMRYNMFFTESFGVFLYGGVVRNVILAANPSGSPTTATRVSNMSQVMPAAGAGLLLQLGPGWYARLDAGIDIAGMSLVLRF